MNPKLVIKESFFALVLCLTCASYAAAQQSSASSTGAPTAASASAAGADQNSPNKPATEADVRQYLQFTQGHEMISKTMQAMSKPMHDMVHREYLKDKEKLPPNFEAQMDEDMDRMMQSMPWDEIMQAEIPIYQKHFTHADMQALIAFYSGPAGQKLLSESPAIAAESMSRIMPLIQQRVAVIQAQIQQEMDAMLKEQKDSAKKTPGAN